ncbi:MAG: flippase-like domain-containing protein [Coriobacteriales bacterium]|jgi:uncharacterized protein (TIRG00374 family)|nr:flippase-like domain-containing protein [Coriobacteriales bacterium]
MRFANVRTLLLGVVIIIALAIIWLRGDQFLELIVTMERGSIIPLVLAVVLQFGKYVSQSYAYAESFKVVGEPTRAREMLPLVFGSYFMNVIAPSFNTAGVMLVIDSARKRGVPTGRATSAALLMQLSVISGFIVIMTVGFIVLQLFGHLSSVWFLLGLVMVFFAGVMVAMLYVGRKNPEFVANLLRPVEKLADKLSRRLRHGKGLKPWVDSLMASFSEAAGNIRAKPRAAARVFGFSTLASTCELGCFCLVGVAFGLLNPPALIGGYVIATLFSWIAITPQGVGVVEAMIVVGLAAYKVNATMATAISLVYRGIVFWMPFAIGAVLIRRTKSFKRELPNSREAARLARLKRLPASRPSSMLPGVHESRLQASELCESEPSADQAEE